MIKKINIHHFPTNSIPELQKFIEEHERTECGNTIWVEKIQNLSHKGKGKLVNCVNLLLMDFWRCIVEDFPNEFSLSSLDFPQIQTDKDLRHPQADTFSWKLGVYKKKKTKE